MPVLVSTTSKNKTFSFECDNLTVKIHVHITANPFQKKKDYKVIRNWGEQVN